jgi:putative cardiolipin synthase
VRRELLVVSPYFVPGDAVVDSLRALVARGVSVKILTNSLASTDVAAVHAGYARYREALLEAGVELYELRPEATSGQRRSSHPRRDGWTPGSSSASLHAKTIAIDGERLFVGSANFDPRSAVLNTEMGIVVENPRLAGLLAEWFVQGMPQIADKLGLAPLHAAWTRPGVEHRLVWTDAAGRPTHPPHREEPGAGWWRRLQVWLLSFLPIEQQL